MNELIWQRTSRQESGPVNHSNCSAERVEADARGASQVVFLCVFHLIAGVAAALLAFGALALFSA